MADGLCTGDTVSNVIEKTLVKDYDNVFDCVNNERVNDVSCENVKSFLIESDSDKLFNKLCSVKGSKHEGFLDVELACTPAEEDCRKKRCADRYDSSESSDSGVAVLGCTDCSGSSTASSDITDPGSPFSTASSHSEDSTSQPAKMPPTQSAHHPPWPWTTGDSPCFKRSSQDKTVSPKKIKIDENDKFPQVVSVLNKTVPVQIVPPVPQQPQQDSSNNKSPSLNSCEKPLIKKVVRKVVADVATPKTQQGKITEYFKSQVKSCSIKKELSNVALKSELKNPNVKYFSLEGASTLGSGGGGGKTIAVRKIDVRTANPSMRKVALVDAKSRKLSPVSVPRRILPAPSKLSDKISHNVSFTPTVTLTAVTIQPNVTYLQTNAPKPPDKLFMPQFAAISGNKINTIPIMNTACLNAVIPPLQKIATINNFNCVKLNATVVPIVKLNTLPSKINGSNVNNVNVTTSLNIDTGVPTVPSAKPKINIPTPIITVTNATPAPSKLPPTHTEVRSSRSEEQSPPDSDSGISSKDQLEISINQTITTAEPQKSPILSQPKTIRFPAKQRDCSDNNTRSHSSDSGLCRWEECHAQFDTSGALLEHLQLKHVISQATQEQYVCLWLGCKVHGRTSCSRTWLERHVLAHAGTKPFRCIVEGCGMRFNSQLALERHVNGHFNSDGTQNGSAKKSVESGSIKLFKRNGKKIRFRRQPWSARMFDFFDAGIMEGLQYHLLTMTDKRTLGQIENVPGDTVTLQSRVIARRTETNGGGNRLLVQWHPTNIIPDEWIHEHEYSSVKTVSIRSLQPSAVNTLKPMLFTPVEDQTKRKHQRKPTKPT